MTNIELVEGQAFEINLVFNTEQGRLNLVGNEISAQIRENYQQDTPILAQLEAQITDAYYGRIKLSLSKKDIELLLAQKPMHPKSPIGFYDIFIHQNNHRRLLAQGRVLYTAQQSLHQKYAPELPINLLPWWMSGKKARHPDQEPSLLSAGVHSFWQHLRSYLLYPLQQTDPLSCDTRLLSLLAWDRGIKRFKTEPLTLFRKRVKYAYVNAQDAGEAAGFKRIFERLDVGIVSVRERQPDTPWDVIIIELSDGELAQKQELVNTLIEHYGRTCRRYRFEVTYPIHIQLLAGHFAATYQTIGATL